MVALFSTPSRKPVSLAFPYVLSAFSASTTERRHCCVCRLISRAGENKEPGLPRRVRFCVRKGRSASSSEEDEQELGLGALLGEPARRCALIVRAAGEKMLRSGEDARLLGLSSLRNGE